jgi:hypothetical protein
MPELSNKVKRTLLKRRKGLSRGLRLKKVSQGRRTRLTAYYALAGAFLRQPQNKYCLICTVRREHGENILIGSATEVHHWAGRIGRLLCYVPYFRPSCFGCRSFPHDHPKEAREWGLLAPAPQWNRFPGNGTHGVETFK